MKLGHVRRLLEIALKSDAELMREMIGPTYRIADNNQSIECLLCGHTSHNLDNVSRKYCDRCQIFHAVIPANEKLEENEFRCQACGRKFNKGRSDKEVEKEYRENFGVGDDLPATVCDDCFNTMTAIIPPPLSGKR